MIPQDSFIIVAEVEPPCLGALRSLLKTMTIAGYTGMADPANPLVRFGDFKTIHFARFVVLADNTLNDRRGYPQLEPSTRGLPTYLCFMVDCDGDADELLARMAQGADGLRKIFGHCKKRHGGIESTAGDISRRTSAHPWRKRHRCRDRDGGGAGCRGAKLDRHRRRCVLSFLFRQREEDQSAGCQRQIALRGEPGVLPE